MIILLKILFIHISKMQSKEIEDSIVYWANQFLHTNDHDTIEDLLNGDFFKAILLSANIDEECDEDEIKLSMGNLEWTLSILNSFYKNWDSIMQYSDYKDIVNNEIIWESSHVILITELIIGLLIK